MSNDAIIIARSIISPNSHRRFINNHSSSYHPDGKIVEYNGKQFRTEYKERIERRYVQIFDQSTGRVRLFEVTDYVPTKIVRSIRHKSHPHLQNKSLSYPQTITYPSNQGSANSTTLNNRPEPLASSKLLGFTNLSKYSKILKFILFSFDFHTLAKHETQTAESDFYRNSTDLSTNSKNQSYASNLAGPQSHQQDANSSSYNSEENSQTRPSNSVVAPAQYGSEQYNTYGSYRSQSRSFRQHTPTNSEYSVGSSAEGSESKF